MPVLNEMTDFNKFVSRDFKGQKFIAHCYEGEKPLLKDILRSGEDALVMIGPEGDFSEEEVAKAIAAGFQPGQFGKVPSSHGNSCIGSLSYAEFIKPKIRI
mgnify:CR=1 FL=1